MKVLVTGSSGLIGSQAVEYFDHAGNQVFGLDNNMRRVFFGPAGDTIWNLRRLKSVTRHFEHFDLDVRDRAGVMALVKERRPDLIIHCAAQPSHDKAREIPLVDFEVNAVGTANLLEATRLYCSESVFILMSTNKVYGSAPNELPLVETETRWEYARPEDYHGISEACRIDQSLHSLFGASKVASDVLAQEYGRYFGMPVGIFRAGCLTGPSHSGVELHGFLSYLVKVALHGKQYRIYGYKGKQVRDQIHSLDIIRAMEAFAKNPRPGEPYNIGGGRANSASVLESIAIVEKIGGCRVNWTYEEQHRTGDHICYISDLRKFKKHYPGWDIAYSLEQITRELVAAETARNKNEGRT